MLRLFMASGLALILFISSALPAWAGDPISMGLDYLTAQQQSDGGFSNGFSDGSDLGTTCDVVLAIAAAGQDASTWRSADDRSPLDYLAAQTAAGAVDSVGMRAKVSMALLATGQDPASFAGHDLLGELEAAYDAETGSYGSSIFDQSLAMLALFDAGHAVPQGAADYLLANQTDDGAWALFGGTTSGTGDTNTTAVAIQALLVTGHRDDIGTAFAYLQRVQNTDGGFPYQDPSPYGTDTDANSTAYVLQALLTAGEPMSNWNPWPSAADPYGALLGLHDPQSGGFFWQAAFPYPNVLATAQAIPALNGYTLVNLPHVGAANPPQAASSGSVILLPQTGGTETLSLLVMAAGLAMMGSGLALRRRK